MIGRRAIRVVFATALLLAVASPAMAQLPYQTQVEGAGGIALGSATVRPNGTLDITGSGFGANARILLQAFSNPVALGSATTDAAGSFAKTVQLPDSVEPGAHTLRATGPGPTGATVSFDVAFTVAAAAAAAPAEAPETSPATADDGSSIGMVLLALFGVAAVLAVAFWLLTRTRRRNVGEPVPA